jgi:hypothetical protein
LNRTCKLLVLGNTVCSEADQVMLNASPSAEVAVTHPRSATPAEEMDIFASSSNPEEPNGAVTSTPISISIKREPPDGQTAVTKRVKFAPVAPLDEGDVEHLCGINGCRPPLEPHPTPHAPRPTPHAQHYAPHTMPTAHHAAHHPPPPTHCPSPTAHIPQHHIRAHCPQSRHPHPALPRARLRCPLSWNHAGICNVITFPGRTQRVCDKAKPPVENCRRECNSSPPGLLRRGLPGRLLAASRARGEPPSPHGHRPPPKGQWWWAAV